ncbi:MAG: S26 family signal peptidase [Phycisphaerales bacterium]
MAVGSAFLVVWCLLMVLSLLGYGSSAGGWCRAGAVILHATAVALVLRPAVKWEGWASRLLIGVGVVLILQMTLYHGLNLLTRGFVGVLPVSGVSETALVRNNDTVLYTGGWTRPDRPGARGNLVVCRLERGYGIDRVIGLPGEHIAVKGGQVYINGLPVPDGVEPLCGASQFPDFAFEVEPGHVAVLPSNLHWTAQGENAQRLLIQLLNRNSHIRESDVLGVAVWRLRPFGRFGAME